VSINYILHLRSTLKQAKKIRALTALVMDLIKTQPYTDCNANRRA